MLVLGLAFLFRATHALLVPSPTGPYSIAVRDFELIDENRIDLLAPKPNTTRRFMASAYLPIAPGYDCEPQVLPYMPALTAKVFGQVAAPLGVPNGTFEKFEIEFCSLSTVSTNINVRMREYPVVIFSPGLGVSRLLYGALARSLAGLGHIVFTVDHTYETYVVEFPDGSSAQADPKIASGEAGNLGVTMQLLGTRTADLSFLVSELSNKTFTSSLFADLPATFDPHKIAAFGHSLGGATAAIATQQDPRVIGGLNLDGQIFGNVLENGFKEKPFVLVATTRGQNSSDLALPGWDEFYKVVDARKMELAIKDTQHNAFLDVPLLLTALEIPTGIRPRLEQAFGMLDGRRLEMVEHKIMSGLLELLFHDKTETLEALGKDPDIDVLKSDLYEGE